MIKNYKEIKPFQRANYVINQPLESLEDWLKEVDRDFKLELNPDFQRGHVWNEKQQICRCPNLLGKTIDSCEVYKHKENCWKIYEDLTDDKKR